MLLKAAEKGLCKVEAVQLGVLAVISMHCATKEVTETAVGHRNILQNRPLQMENSI